MVSFGGLGLDRPLDRAILIGGGSFLKGLIPLLTSDLGIELTVGNAFDGLKASENLTGLGAIYVNATGLAIEEV
ncbi:hypothetical protein HYS10_01915 [Candidatus Collierbacteria bacterium]|nr:hypothetical protein [Candidatus Collierbacteria bacterium]